MGTTQSSDYYGEFTQCSKCSCSDSKKQITEIKFDSCRDKSLPMHVVSNVFSKVSGTVNLISAKDPQWNANHTFIELTYDCLDCYKKGYIVIEYKANGIIIRYGFYGNISTLTFKDSIQRDGLFFDEIKRILEKLKSEKNFCAYYFDPISKNNQHFANELWKTLCK